MYNLNFYLAFGRLSSHPALAAAVSELTAGVPLRRYSLPTSALFTSCHNVCPAPIIVIITVTTVSDIILRYRFT